LNNSTVYLFCATEPVIESSTNLIFGPYNVSYPLQDKHAEAADLNIGENKWDMVFDFTDTNETGEKIHFLHLDINMLTICHHSLIDPSLFKIVEQPVEGFDDPMVNPFELPQRYGGYAEDHDLSKKKEGDDIDGSEQTFDIRTTSAADATKMYEEHQRKLEEKLLQEQTDDVLGGKQNLILNKPKLA
jgi:hypothetical protein